MNYTSPLNENIKFGLLSKLLPVSGNMAWEYNPFRNYRLSENKYYFRGKFFTKEELEKELGGEIIGNSWDDFRNISNYPNGIQSYEDDPILYEKNLLIDFDTEELNFNIEHPVDIKAQYSYDGSVNLILNDGLNTPKLINSRFSPLGKNKYLIVDRKGNNDTNIYDLGSLFNSDTSLYKTYIGIPKIDFINVITNGNLTVGNYHFYFKYVDSDGNETDFIGESGLVSVFKGNSFKSINSGFRDENAHKSVLFIISNTDPGYDYINVYYTKSTSDINENYATSAFKIDLKFPINNSYVCLIIITGDESKVQITTDEINIFYQIADNVKTQETCQNMLFFGNILKPSIDYYTLADISLRFTANITTKNYIPIGHNYEGSITDTYADPNFIYNFTGYLNDELYRFGIVYILNDGSLSPVFNIRGIYFENGNEHYTDFPVYKDGKKYYIKSNEDTGLIYSEDNSENISKSLENIYGVVRVHINEDETRNIIGIKIEVLDSNNVFSVLNQCNIKGYFFVRQKRMPLRLCQAFTIGIDSESNTPLIYTNDKTIISSKNKLGGEFYIAERFLTDDRELVHTFLTRLYCINKTNVYKYGAVCPEYDVNSPYLNSIFCGDEYYVQLVSKLSPLILNTSESRQFYVDTIEKPTADQTVLTKIVGLLDNTKLIGIDTKKFSARAGEAEDASKYEYLNNENKTLNASNLIRGIFGPYLALSGYNISGTLVNIYLKDYKTMDKQLLFKLRYLDKSPYFAISERYSTQNAINSFTLFRGDSYICTFTHRLNRNFQDSSAPTNDKIVDEKCWKNNYRVKDGVVILDSFLKINRGDINAIKLGMWVTFPVVSSMNLQIRSLDSSNTSEEALFGNPRTFFPYTSISADGVYKMPEALCYNKGFSKLLSERYNFELPNVPAIKNDFTNRISYSDVNVNDAFKNGYRIFLGTHYRDYPKTYGQITKLIELRGNLICVFEHGIALIPVNERTVAAEGAGGSAFINTSNVLPENPKILSDTFGSQWKDSIIKTPVAIYGVDTIGKKIWRTNGEVFECISDFKIQEFLNKNISLSEREITPMIGIRNVKTHYNKFKRDVMFTFYDNLYGFEEKVWNLCYNELLQQWVTFYSWIPSYSENIYNQYFSFDRNTSKWIAKLGISKTDNSFSDGICISNNIIPNNAESEYEIGELNLINRTLPSGDNIKTKITYELVRDNFGNEENFKISTNKDGKLCLYLKTNAVNLCSELFERGDGTVFIKNPKELKEAWIENCIKNNNYYIHKNEQGRKIYLDLENQYNASKIVILLNIKANILVIYEGNSLNLAESYISGFKNGQKVDAGYYLSTIALIPLYNMQFLTTDFWKHGLAGIIDIADKILPTHWYGKLHPFEFEFVVADKPQFHKIFDNLEIISNSAEPESFHYEIIGDSYEFAKDKKNMYIRQEATKELYLYNGSDILFDSDYINLDSEHRKQYMIQNGTKIELQGYDKSTLFPLYYCRQDDFNNIEDYYHLKEGVLLSKDFSALSGAEIVKYDTLQEYRIWSHAKAIDINDDTKGRLRGNMLYKEDKWYVLINPINLVLKNESTWTDMKGNETNKIPVELNLNPLPSDILNPTEIRVPPNFNRGYVLWNWLESQNKEVKVKDKWIKIRVRYKGDKLAIISAIKTLYSICYG